MHSNSRRSDQPEVCLILQPAMFILKATRILPRLMLYPCGYTIRSHSPSHYHLVFYLDVYQYRNSHL